ncbi:hypothetical protein TOPH_04528 [Tolypocladium ophioglossoides CBS 100239]|uniref:Fungal N-terminal domain-containing protein n=1 Tax=Tolypocladium ophioglossoides (strain CBS 100239) TaxID=1163406 RepID=A0A0L0NA22_TOLOC|nr:hypothetical protein TOPH_04528 [Tolypocladium ophioglossoides CBS 100239]
MAANTDQDSPLSITSSVVGILTFVVAIAAATYARVTYLRNSDDEYFRVKTSLSWYKTESAWLADLLTAFNAQHHDDVGSRSRKMEHQMYAFVMEDLLNLEQRLLDLVMEVEAKASTSSNVDSSFALLPRSWQGGRPSVAMAWLPVRTKALELVRQREALTARVQFLQMSMMSSRLRDLELRTRWGEAKSEEGSKKLDGLLESQKEGILRQDALMGCIKRGVGWKP